MGTIILLPIKNLVEIGWSYLHSADAYFSIFTADVLTYWDVKYKRRRLIMDRRLILTFIAMGIGVLVIAVDLASINVALPAIEKSFEISLGTVEWIVNGYLLAFGVLLVTTGRLADIYGRRKIFLIGIVIFGAASLIGGLSQGSGLLISMRVLQGVGAAFLWPSIIGICYSSVPENQKGYAMGLIFGVSGLGNAAGPLIGGILTEFLSWRWVLFVNVPLTIIAGLITLYVVSEQSAEGEDQGVDYIGVIAISITLVSFLYAVDQSISWGWLSIKTIGLIIISVIFLFLFLKFEQKEESALIPKEVMKNRGFMAYCLVMATLCPTFFCIFLYLPQYLEKFKHYTPLQAGAALVPIVLSFGLTSPFSGKIYNSLGAKMSIIIGMLLLSIGTFGIVIFGIGTSYIYLVPPSLICGIGFGIALPCITTAAVGYVEEYRASLAGGIVMMFQMSGAALGLAVATTIFIDTAINDFIGRISALDLNLSGSDVGNIKSFILGSSSEQILEKEVGSSMFNKLIPHIRDSYVKGLKIGLGFTGTIVFIGALMTLFFTKSRQNK
ncbi:MFS transporter [Desulfobacterota bacterium AH_259_B03_O07]|nr:MFS transporter [Desulfobacterota bacterium AH_259_B03_O07]